MSREEQLDWLCRLRSEVKIYMPREWIDHFEDALTESIEALSQEPDKYRKEAKRWKNKWLKSQKKTGHWIQLDYQRGKFECSECHTQGYVDTCMYEPKWKYCPNCGAKMESEEV